jgi:hypothetical protein
MGRQVRASSTSADVISASNASFSDNRQYRWWLHRQWTFGLGLLLFIGLNPSRADGERDDPTLEETSGIREVVGISRVTGGQFVCANFSPSICPAARQ